jgi:hypothetical protein
MLIIIPTLSIRTRIIAQSSLAHFVPPHPSISSKFLLFLPSPLWLPLEFLLHRQRLVNGEHSLDGLHTFLPRLSNPAPRIVQSLSDTPAPPQTPTLKGGGSFQCRPVPVNGIFRESPPIGCVLPPRLPLHRIHFLAVRHVLFGPHRFDPWTRDGLCNEWGIQPALSPFVRMPVNSQHVHLYHEEDSTYSSRQRSNATPLTRSTSVTA